MNSKVRFGTHFLKSVTKLPKEQQKKLARLLVVFQEKPFAAQLHTKPLTGRLAGYYSFRITREWRVIFQFIDPENIMLLKAAHRKDIYR